MLHIAVQGLAYRLKAKMRMIGCADGLAWRVVVRAHLIEEKEGIDNLKTCAWEGPADDEAGAHSLTM